MCTCSIPGLVPCALHTVPINPPMAFRAPLQARTPRLRRLRGDDGTSRDARPGPPASLGRGPPGRAGLRAAVLKGAGPGHRRALGVRQGDGASMVQSHTAHSQRHLPASAGHRTWCQGSGLPPAGRKGQCSEEGHTLGQDSFLSGGPRLLPPCSLPPNSPSWTQGSLADLPPILRLACQVTELFLDRCPEGRVHTHETQLHQACRKEEGTPSLKRRA